MLFTKEKQSHSKLTAPPQKYLECKSSPSTESPLSPNRTWHPCDNPSDRTSRRVFPHQLRPFHLLYPKVVTPETSQADTSPLKAEARSNTDQHGGKSKQRGCRIAHVDAQTRTHRAWPTFMVQVSHHLSPSFSQHSQHPSNHPSRRVFHTNRTRFTYLRTNSSLRKRPRSTRPR